MSPPTSSTPPSTSAIESVLCRPAATPAGIGPGLVSSCDADTLAVSEIDEDALLEDALLEAAELDVAGVVLGVPPPQM